MSRTLAVAAKLVLVVLLFALLVSCTSSTGPSAQLTCEQRFDRALERGVSYTGALGDYTQCLIDRGDTVNTSARNY